MPTQRELVDAWYQRSAGNQHLHYVAADHYSRANYLLGVPVIVLSAGVGTSVFASLQQQKPVLWVQLLIGLASVTAAVLASLQTFLRYSDRGDKHRLAGAKYGAIGRELEQLLAAPELGPAAMIDEIRKRLDALALESPHVPLFLVRKADNAGASAAAIAPVST